MIVAVTPLGSGPIAKVTFPVKFVRVTLTVTVGELPPCKTVTAGALILPIAMLTGLTVRSNVPVADVTPLPEAVAVTVWLFTTTALLLACRIIEPVFPEPGSVIVAVTPLGSWLRVRVTFPVKLVRAMLNVMVGELPPWSTVADGVLMLLMAMLTGLMLRSKVTVVGATPAPLAVIVMV